MSAPTKKGLDYFTCDCIFEDNIELVIAEFGLKGLGILIRLWQKIYSTGGFYCQWDDDVALMFAAKNNLGVNVVSEFIDSCLRRGLFDRGMLESCSILTSKGIQKRYFEATKRREQKNINTDYLLIELPDKTVNVNNNSVNVNNNPEIVCNNSQSKVKESKVKESKVNHITLENLKNKINNNEVNARFAELSRMIDVDNCSDNLKEIRAYPYKQISMAEKKILSDFVRPVALTRYLELTKEETNVFELILKFAIAEGELI